MEIVVANGIYQIRNMDKISLEKETHTNEASVKTKYRESEKYVFVHIIPDTGHT